MPPRKIFCSKYKEEKGIRIQVLVHSIREWMQDTFSLCIPMTAPQHLGRRVFWVKVAAAKTLRHVTELLFNLSYIIPGLYTSLVKLFRSPFFFLKCLVATLFSSECLNIYVISECVKSLKFWMDRCIHVPKQSTAQFGGISVVFESNMVASMCFSA